MPMEEIDKRLKMEIYWGDILIGYSYAMQSEFNFFDKMQLKRTLWQRLKDPFNFKEFTI